MYSTNYAESLAKGILLLEPQARLLDRAVELLATGEGSRSGCLLMLASNASAISVFDFFQSKSLQRAKQWAYVSARLKIMLEHEKPESLNLEDLFWALISDNQDVVGWWRQHRLFGHDIKSPDALENIKSDAFIRRQTLRALNGQWDELNLASEQALARPELFKRVRPRLIQFSFYRELAQGNVDGMREILLDMCSPNLRSRSYQYESGLTNNFIVMLATLFAKLAWRHGYELDIDTPWIPKEWLPIRPNEKYEDPWPFMQNFDIWQPFPEPWTQYSPVRPT